jgi:TPR repeat protein
LPLLLLPGTGHACGWWGDGESADAVTAVTITPDGRILEKEADPMDNPDEMIRIGDTFRTGDGPPRDYNLALHWYRLAAERGHLGGQYNLARMYDHGLGVHRDAVEAARWYQRAAEQGEVHSQHHLAEMYRDGRGVSRDPGRSREWFEAAARQGHVEVFPELAMAYQQGEGVARDMRRAYLWWWLAAQGGDPEAIRRVAWLRRQMTAEEAGQAEAEGRSLRAGWRRGGEAPGS